MSQELILYTQDAPDLPQERAAGWYLVARGKVKMEAALQAHELALQSVLHEYDKLPQADLAKQLASYKSGWADLVTERKKFTSILDGVKEMCMEIEKRTNPATNATYLAASKLELDTRMAAQKKQNDELQKLQEIAKFRAHVENQYASMAMDYRTRLKRLVAETYSACLYAKTPQDDVIPAIQKCIAAMAELRPFAPARFMPMYMSQEELNTEGMKMQPPKWDAIYNEVYTELNEKFSMYANDLGAAEQIANSTMIELEADIATQSAELEQQQATTTLLASANVVVGEVINVKTNTKIKIKDDDQKFVLAIMAAFMSNFQKVMPLLRIKKLSVLSIAQMAVALDAAKIQVVDVEYETVNK